MKNKTRREGLRKATQRPQRKDEILNQDREGEVFHHEGHEGTRSFLIATTPDRKARGGRGSVQRAAFPHNFFLREKRLVGFAADRFSI